MTIEELGKHCIIIDFSDLFTKSVTNINYKQGEIGTASIKAKLVKKRTPIDLTGCRVILNIMTEKGEPIVDTATILDEKEGIIEIKFEQVSLNTGISFFELTIMDANYNTKKSPKIAYRVLDSLSEDAVIESERFPILVNMIRDVEGLHTTAEGLVNETRQLNQEVVELNNTMTQAELVRETQEGSRQENEIDRQASETSREQDEESRKAQEVIREQNEATRIENMNRINTEVGDLISTSTQRIDSKIAEMETQLSESINTKFETFDASVEVKMGELTALQDSVSQKLVECTTKVDEKIVDIQTQLDDATQSLDNKVAVINGEIDSLKQSVGSGKNVLAKAVTDMGIPTLADYSFEDIARNISLINKATFLDTEFTQSTTVDNTVSARMGVKSIKGKTLVNLMKSKLVSIPANANSTTSMGNVRLEKDKVYTVIYNVLKPSTVGKSSLGYYLDTFWLHESAWENLNSTVGVKVYKFNSKVSGDIRFRWWSNNSTTDVEVSDFVLLEGDHTQNPPEFFENMLSVGQDNQNKIEISSGNKDSTVSNKKEILLSESLKGVNDSICDEIAYLDETDANVSQGKGLYHIKRCDERPYQAGDESNSNVVTDMTNTVYQLDSPIITKIDDIEIYSHEEQTNLFVSGGVIPVHCNFSIARDINSVVNTLSRQVADIEKQQEENIKYILSGDMRALATTVYPNDFEVVEEVIEEEDSINK